MAARCADRQKAEKVNIGLSAIATTPERRLTLQFALLVLIWSTSFLWIKILVAEIPPGWLAVSRLVLGACVLSVAALLNQHGKEANIEAGLPWRVILVAALLGNALPYTLIHAGEVTVDSGVAAVLIGTMPLATFVCAWLILGERLSSMQLGGLALGFVGLIVLIGTDALAGLGQTWGQLLVIGGSVCYALSATLVRKLGSSRSIMVAALTLWLAAACVTPFAFLESPNPVFPQSGQTWIALLILGALCTGGAAWLYFQLLGQVPANKFAQINYIIPLLGYLWGLIFMGETLRWQAVLAAAMIIVGVRAVLRNRPLQ
ncbi:MAG: DMT family transporter [Granulosicoccus sp.]|nr:DMT family transporter [Granulosicoccus sp.]